MKTIKIPEQLHKDLRRLQAEMSLKTIPETIRFLYLYQYENKKGNKENDKSKK